MTKFFKLPMPSDPHGRKTPGYWLNPIFFRFIVDHIKASPLADLELLPASIWALILPEKQALVSLNHVALNESDSPATLGKIVKLSKGSLHVNPAFLAAVIEHELSETKPGGAVATKLCFIGDKVTKFGDLKNFTVEGTSQEVAKKLGIELSDG